jgi:hypothetical protein
MRTSLAPERTDAFYSYSVFKRLSVIVWCPMYMNIIAPKTGALQMGSKTLNDDFLENYSNDFD